MIGKEKKNATLKKNWKRNINVLSLRLEWCNLWLSLCILLRFLSSPLYNIMFQNTSFCGCVKYKKRIYVPKLTKGSELWQLWKEHCLNSSNQSFPYRLATCAIAVINYFHKLCVFKHVLVNRLPWSTLVLVQTVFILLLVKLDWSWFVVEMV